MPEINLDHALVFIDEHGNLQDKARLLSIMMSEPPAERIIRPLLDKQNKDGGFPSRPRSENPSSVDNTLTAIWQLNELGMLSSPETKRAFDFLISTQASDGSWDENPELPGHDLPPWIVPGQLPTKMYLTAYSAYWLALAGFANSSAVEKAAQFLVEKQETNGHLPGYLHGHWIGTSLFLLAGASFQNAAELGIAYLAERAMHQWEDSQIAWALDCLGSAGLSASRPFIETLLTDLVQRQELDGSWSSEDGPAYAVSATLSALKALKRFGWIAELNG